MIGEAKFTGYGLSDIINPFQTNEPSFEPSSKETLEESNQIQNESNEPQEDNESLQEIPIQNISNQIQVEKPQMNESNQQQVVTNEVKTTEVISDNRDVREKLELKRYLALILQALANERRMMRGYATKSMLLGFGLGAGVMLLGFFIGRKVK